MPDGAFPPDPFDANAAESAARPPRGAAPVSRMEELSPLETAAVMYFRLWHDGEAGRARATADFAALLGLGHGAAAVQALDRLCALLGAHGRRPLMRHSKSCSCVGSDEAVVAAFLSRAAEGEREEAMLMASLLIRAEMAPLALAVAEELAVALRRLALRAAPEPRRRAEAPRRPVPRRVH
ncbi:hypothetical protein ACQ5SO_13435 [Rhodovulum sp. DZ06]|uniref:hypothetical protein n=1 Tax=Rhodovulum sp. DZ06 TaxID=3425126 RepID=UPI003D32B599